MSTEACQLSAPAAAPDSIYWSAARHEIARVLSWQDREACSRTHGCFDRTYWCWKFTDFPAARFQEAVYTLAHLYTTPLADNRLRGDPHVLQWIQAGVDFWRGLQRRDGSFDEAYPFEHSLAATAFTGFYVGEAFLRMRDVLPRGELALDTFARAGDWLCRNDERHGVLSNHLAAAAVALHVLARITGDGRFDLRCWEFVQRIYDHQSSEGWYEEYGGADPGYQTLSTFYLARLWHYTRDARLQESLARSVSFLTHCVHPNRTLGGEYGSRNTEFFFPAGCEMLAGAIPDAACIARFMRASLPEGRNAGLWAMDAQNLLPMLNNYLFAADHSPELPDGGASALPCERSGEWWFPDAGLLIKSTPAFYAVVGLSKGGVVKIYDKRDRRLAVSDCGYVARLRGGTLATTQTLDRGPRRTHTAGACTVEADFVPLLRRAPTTWLFIAFRGFSTTLGRAQRIAYWLKHRLVEFLMRPRSALPLRLTRSVQLGDDAVTVTDELVAAGRVDLVECRRAQKFSAVHMGSSRYFQWQELECGRESGEDCATDLLEHGRARVVWTWTAPAAGRGA
jgi:hypothetical protein